jgi:membrane fusion protein, macrolide-specific efflux system
VYFTTLGGEGKRWFGKLRQVNPTPAVVNNVVLYDALFDVANPGQELMTQMTAQVFFVVSHAKDAVYVPVSALRPVGGQGRRAGRGPGKGGGKGRPEGASKSEEQAKAGPGRVADVAPDPRSLFPDGRAIVRVVAEDGSISDREVQLGIMTRVSAQVVSGLEPGEKVVSGIRAAGAPKAGAEKGAQGGAPKFTPRL